LQKLKDLPPRLILVAASLAGDKKRRERASCTLSTFLFFNLFLYITVCPKIKNFGAFFISEYNYTKNSLTPAQR